MRHAAALLTILLLAACAAVEKPSNLFFSSLLSREDIANITALVAQRSDIQQPICEITSQDPRRYLFVVRTGDPYRDGAPSDRFTVQKLRGTWRIVSPVSHERIKLERVIITQMNTPRGLTRRCS